MKTIKLLDHYFGKVVEALLVVLLLGILFMSVGNIVLRLFDISFLWMEPALRHLVFICIFLGGVLATGNGHHIAIDILRRSLENSPRLALKKSIDVLVTLISLFTLGWLIKAGVDFSKVEFEFGKEQFWGIHSGVLTAIIPAGFGLVALRFVFNLIFIVTGHKREQQ